ncbi:MAG: nucleotidyltransferase domain-containing protein [bacterium]|nr:nucleotidyltransferase domain-containing protein [bacterium]
MSNQDPKQDRLLWSLRERAKELNCLYRIEEWLNKPGATLEQVCNGIIEAIPGGWQHSDVCQARIMLTDITYAAPGFRESAWVMTETMNILDQSLGSISVYYTQQMPIEDDGPFLTEERKLLTTIADRLASHIAFHKMRAIHRRSDPSVGESSTQARPEWKVILNFLWRTDRNLYLTISTKMLNYLCWSGVVDARELSQDYYPDQAADAASLLSDSNVPHRKRVAMAGSEAVSDKIFKIASEHLSQEEIVAFVQRWITQDKLGFLVKTLANVNTPLPQLSEAIRRFHRMAPEDVDFPINTKRGLLVSLIRRIFSESLEYINIAKNYVDVYDIFEVMQNVIYLPGSQGKLGGKAAGIFLAGQILKKSVATNPLLTHIKTPKAWYITSDVVLHFMSYNNFDEVVEQKYKEVDQIRLEYPNVIQTFKNAVFPPEILKALSVVLDDFADHPLIVRSSSLLEDRTGASFSGKYKSLFLANQGSKDERLAALLDAIAEVYASTFGPDPIEYRAERGLLDFHEEMGIIIQQVIGTKSGKYFLPAFAGVAFSQNELRWSPRIRRSDGLIRIVPGLGTRAVDRTSDDYPILVSPGQPGLRVNVTADEMARYSPKMIDVINLETNTFETLHIDDLLHEFGDEIPMINQIVSIDKGDHIQRPLGHIDFASERLVVTFEGLLTNTPFVAQVQSILKTLEEKLGEPVDMEFAHDGTDFYLLQCRPQSHSEDSGPAALPKDVQPDKVLFTASRYVSNGRVPDITHLVYVDPQAYGSIKDRQTLLNVGRAVSRLNHILPKRQFILMGPGRWGSRGDIKLGVSVTYSDINNTAMLIEIARQSGHYVPDLSFGTHFFQDLVEAQIRYLPLYPDDGVNVMNDRFLLQSENILGEVLPEYESLSSVIRLIDVPRSAGGQVVHVLMNAELDKAVAMLAAPRARVQGEWHEPLLTEASGEHYWRWRFAIAEQIAAMIDPDRFGVLGFYLFGSTKNANAKPGSDIDILIHFAGTANQRQELESWLEGWSLCLSEVNFERTGLRVNKILDVHIVTDEDIANKNSYALKIGAVTDAARPLPIGKSTK